MSIKQEIKALAYHQKISTKKVKVIQKKLIRVFNIPLFKKTEHQKALLLDVRMMHEDLLDVLFNAKIESQKHYISLIDAFLDLECKAYEYKARLVYKVGEMDKVVKAILLQHGFIDLKNEIFKDVG